MVDSPAAGRPRASWWEIGGAWLHIWTPPRDTEVPRPPRRALFVVGLLVVAAAVAVVTLVAPAIDRSKEHTAALHARSEAATRRAIETRLAAEQRAHFARAPVVASLYAAGHRNASLAALIADARAHVDRDVRARVASGALPGPIERVQCDPRSRELGARVHLDCLAVTAVHEHKTHELQLGHPFVVGASLRDGRYAWCKDNPKPGEASFGHSIEVPLPVACTG